MQSFAGRPGLIYSRPYLWVVALACSVWYTWNRSGREQACGPHYLPWYLWVISLLYRLWTTHKRHIQLPWCLCPGGIVRIRIMCPPHPAMTAHCTGLHVWHHHCHSRWACLQWLQQLQVSMLLLMSLATTDYAAHVYLCCCLLLGHDMWCGAHLICIANRLWLLL